MLFIGVLNDGHERIRKNLLGVSAGRDILLRLKW